MKTLFLDFDGVLFDTVLESYLLARYAYFNTEPFEKVDNKEYQLFHSVRYLITNSWHYFYIMKLIQKNTKPKDFPEEYKNTISVRDIEADSEFDKKFQAKRKDLMQNHFDFWNKLDKPYPFLEKIKSLKNNLNIVIVSTKNEEAVLKHCIDYGFNIEEKNIIGKTKLKEFGSKRAFIKNYMLAYNLPDAIFVDDAIETINKCSDIPNLKALCANWGYAADKNDGYAEDEILQLIKEIKP